MLKFCTNCGNKINKEEKFCTKCGYDFSRYNNEIIINRNISASKNNYGTGLSIAGMILGIVSVLWCIRSLISLNNVATLFRIYDFFYNSFILILFSFFYTLFSFIPSITGLFLSFFGYRKKKNNINISGLILNSISLALTSFIFIYIISFI